jgi:glycosyltransferase involved in cell wall biosynthesis
LALPTWQLLIRYDARELKSCDGLIAVNQTQRRTIPDDFQGETAVIWLWLSPAIEGAIARVAGTQVEALREQWRAGAGEMVFGSVGRLTPAKGMDTLVRAFKTAFAAGEQVRLVIVGDGENRGALEELAAGDQRIVFAGHQTEIAPFYRAFDVFVSASRFEPFGLAIIEAMAAGCRLIVTRTDGPSEFLNDPGALWAAPDSIDDLAAQLRAATASGRGRTDHDMSRLTVDRLAADIEAFYRRVLQPVSYATGGS